MAAAKLVPFVKACRQHASSSVVNKGNDFGGCSLCFAAAAPPLAADSDDTGWEIPATGDSETDDVPGGSIFGTPLFDGNSPVEALLFFFVPFTLGFERLWRLGRNHLPLAMSRRASSTSVSVHREIFANIEGWVWAVLSKEDRHVFSFGSQLKHAVGIDRAETYFPVAGCRLMRSF